MRPILLLAILLLTGCPKDPVESPPVHDDTGEPPDSGMDDTGAPPVTGFTATTEVLDGSGGTIVLEFTAVEQGAVAQRFTVGAGATFGTDALADGAYGLRAWLDEDGDADNIDDMVALYALRDGEDLYLGLQLAGPVVDAPAGTTWQLWLAPQDGDGDLPATDLGAMLSYRAEPATMPGASAVVELLGSGCLDCADFATSGQSLEARLTLPDLGLDTGPVQLIAVRAASRGEALLPAHGALLSDGDDGTVLVTFEVDAAAVAEGISGDTTITLSGDRAELGAWVGHALELFDDGQGMDAVAGDAVWTTTVALEAGGSVAYKYLLGDPTDPSWEGVESQGDDRVLWVEDIDASGRVRVLDAFGETGAILLDP